jgi:hypothetical protein
MSAGMYVVVTFNQASKQPDGDAFVYLNLDEALDDRDAQREQTASVGRRERHEVYELVEIEDDES